MSGKNYKDQPCGGEGMEYTFSGISNNSQESAATGFSSSASYRNDGSSNATSPGSTFSHTDDYNEYPPVTNYYEDYQQEYTMHFGPMQMYTQDVVATGGWSAQPYQTTATHSNMFLDIDQSPESRNDFESRYTTKMLGWTGVEAQMRDYTFVVPAAGFPHFQLKQGISASPHQPSIVYLEDQDQRSQKIDGYKCQYPTKNGVCCNKNGKPAIFRRGPDLGRHYENVHIPKECRNRQKCDYAKCDRASGDPISRKDHLREHYRENHREDLSGIWKRKNDSKSNAQKRKWWDNRIIVLKRWRCEKCLHKNKTSKGWTCENCSTQCEQDRIDHRAERARQQGHESFDNPIDDAEDIVPYDVPEDSAFGLACSKCFYEYRINGLDECEHCHPPTFNSYGEFDAAYSTSGASLYWGT